MAACLRLFVFLALISCATALAAELPCPEVAHSWQRTQTGSRPYSGEYVCIGSTGKVVGCRAACEAIKFRAEKASLDKFQAEYEQRLRYVGLAGGIVLLTLICYWRKRLMLFVAAGFNVIVRPFRKIWLDFTDYYNLTPDNLGGDGDDSPDTPPEASGSFPQKTRKTRGMVGRKWDPKRQECVTFIMYPLREHPTAAAHSLVFRDFDDLFDLQSCDKILGRFVRFEDVKPETMFLISSPALIKSGLAKNEMEVPQEWVSIMKIPKDFTEWGHMQIALEKKLFTLYQMYRETDLVIYLEEMLFYLRFHRHESGFVPSIRRVLYKLRDYEISQANNPDEFQMFKCYLAGKLGMFSLQFIASI